MGTLIITLSVDWDAYNDKSVFIDSITNDLIEFNNQLSIEVGKVIPVTHFICPAFYIRNLGLESDYTNAINGLLRAEDEVGLHIHCWKSLTTKSNVAYQNTPSAFDTGEPKITLDGYHDDEGRGVPLGAYSKEQIIKMINTSINLLKKINHVQTVQNNKITSFRCGGWLTNDTVFKALEETGFTHEASGVAYDSLYRYPGCNPMYQMLEKLWRIGYDYSVDKCCKNSKRRSVYPNGVVDTTQPKKIGNIVEVPDTGVLAEYISEPDMINHIKNSLTLATTNDYYISLGFHHCMNNGWPLLLNALKTYKSEIVSNAIKFDLISNIPAT